MKTGVRTSLRVCVCVCVCVWLLFDRRYGRLQYLRFVEMSVNVLFVMFVQRSEFNSG